MKKCSKENLRAIQAIVQEKTGAAIVPERKTAGDKIRKIPEWSWPTVSRKVSGLYGIRENGTHSEHVNIAGTAGDEIYAVADGVVLEAAFESYTGNFIVVDLGDGVTVKYGHLKEIKVSEGEEIKQ
ncbi:MAG: M23 family metallopeptidase [Lachnospiraceae bacterium]|nr:M23 family metallopeptidase [Lachnospiraceae bacterium]